LKEIEAERDGRNPGGRRPSLAAEPVAARVGRLREPLRLGDGAGGEARCALDAGPDRLLFFVLLLGGCLVLKLL
jgi:hypothetical protein